MVHCVLNTKRPIVIRSILSSMVVAQTEEDCYHALCYYCYTTRSPINEPPFFFQKSIQLTLALLFVVYPLGIHGQSKSIYTVKQHLF